MKKVERRFSRLELAHYLADLARQLQNGSLAIEGRNWAVPEQVEAAIHLKEEDGSLVAKIKMRWPLREGGRPISAAAAPRQQDSFEAVKARLSTGFKELQRDIKGGMSPDEKTLRGFAEDSRLLAKFAGPEWKKPLAEYLVHVENLQRAMENRQPEAMVHELQALTASMNACHREFKS